MTPPLLLSTFRADVTPPLGHPLTASWYPPAIAITDPLYANGIVLIPPNAAPIVICAIDWSEISNESYHAWQCALANAAGTTFDRVAIHCTHAHNTPWPDAVANQLAMEHGAEPLMDSGWCDETMRRVAVGLKQGLSILQSVDSVKTGEAVVEGIASNRRIMGSNGKVRAVRWTVTRDPATKAEPEGLIDPKLRSISFSNGSKRLAVLYFYTTHPTSFDNDGLVTSEFCGLARERRQKQEPDTCFLYLTGCAGNITPGKYNDGNLESRYRFRDILFDAMTCAEAGASPVDFSNLTWSTYPVTLPARAEFSEKSLRPVIADSQNSQATRSRAALQLAYVRRLDRPILVGCLSISPEAAILSLPAEAFVEYQLFAQELRPCAWIAVAAYADCGPGYITLARSFDEGGYEVVDSFVGPAAEGKMREAIRGLLE